MRERIQDGDVGTGRNQLWSINNVNKTDGGIR